MDARHFSGISMLYPGQVNLAASSLLCYRHAAKQPLKPDAAATANNADALLTRQHQRLLLRLLRQLLLRRLLMQLRAMDGRRLPASGLDADHQRLIILGRTSVRHGRHPDERMTRQTNYETG